MAHKGTAAPLRTCLRRVLMELEAAALLTLRREPKLEVMVCRDLISEVDLIRAYFPMRPGLQTPKLRIPERGTEAVLASAIRVLTDDVYRRRLIVVRRLVSVRLLCPMQCFVPSHVVSRHSSIRTSLCAEWNGESAVGRQVGVGCHCRFSMLPIAVN
jgi:hypothetical protein